MNVLILAYGTRGDVEPFVALGRGLGRAGHRVTLCTAARFENFVRDHELDFEPLTDELLQLLDSAAGREMIENARGVFGAIKAGFRMMKYVKPINRRITLDSLAAAEKTKPDFILFHPKTLAGPHIAERDGIPVMLALLQPIFVPTAAFPATGFPTWPRYAWYNRLTYKITQLGLASLRGIVNELRVDYLGLAPMPRGGNPLTRPDGSSLPVLHAFSPRVVPPPADWPDTVHTTGYWFLDSAHPGDFDWRPSAELAAFLEAGEPPVYFGFGRMAGRRPERLARIVIEACERAGVRGILATGWGGLEADELPATMFRIEAAPHAGLFPLCAALVHHGGAGTTAAGLRSGRPALVVPFLGDQPYWGARVADLGAGVAPIPQKKLTAAKLADALRTLTTDEPLRKRAAELGRELRTEDGVATAVRLIEEAADV